MSRRLFLFGIGGTGSRVIKSLIMLLASGCKLPGDVDTVVPMLIDPDTGNGDLNRTKNILALYQNIRNKIHKPDDFFRQKVTTINEIGNDTSQNFEPDYFQFKIDKTSDNTFRQFIGFTNLKKKDKDFLELLYSDHNLSSNLNVGFKGNPHMGAVVLDQFTNSDDFQRFSQTFSQGDIIFIANSIFGGTGAAGFPLLLKTLRAKNNNLQNAARIRKSPIGGLTYLPYFSVKKNNNSDINSQSFDEKTKQALRYYKSSIIDKQEINNLYLLGLDGAKKTYENHVGAKKQKNDAHFLELAGALSIFNFCGGLSNYTVKNGKAVNGTTVKEFGIQRDTQDISFKDLDSSHSEIIASNLTKFNFFTNYLSQGLERAMGVTRWTVKKTLLNEDFFKSAAYKNYIKKFCNHFDEWIDELDNNQPSFSPFKPVTSTSKSLDFVKNKTNNDKDGFKELDIENCKIINNTDSSNAFTQLIKLFDHSTKSVLSNNKIIKQ